ncbi:unnamed protein product, partial [Symbiodinium pilosum]
AVPPKVESAFTAADRPPQVLVEFRRNRMDQEILMQENVFRRYVSFMGAIKDKEMRLHGRWMELSTSAVGDETLKRNSLLHSRASRRVSEHP